MSNSPRSCLRAVRTVAVAIRKLNEEPMNHKTPIEHVEFGTEVTWNRKRYKLTVKEQHQNRNNHAVVRLRNVATGQIKSLPFGTLVTVAKAKVTR